MVRRSTSQFKIDELAFPIRVKFVVPEGGMRELPEDTHAWLRENLDRLAWAWGPAQSMGTPQATAYYFRVLEDAQRFVGAFPGLELADGVASGVYSSPAKSAGAGRAPGSSHSIGGDEAP